MTMHINKTEDGSSKKTDTKEQVENIKLLSVIARLDSEPMRTRICVT